AHHRCGRALEAVRAGAAARLLDLAARLGLAARSGAAARALGRAQVQLAGETGGVLIVLDTGDHRVRAAVALVLGTGAALVARRRRLGMAMAMGRLARGRIGVGLGRASACAGGLLGFLAQPLGLGILLALELGGRVGTALVFLGQALLLGEVALARLLELAQDLGLLVVHPGGAVGLGGLVGRLDQRDLPAHHHVDGRAVLAATDGEFLLARAVERDLLWRNRVLGGLV